MNKTSTPILFFGTEDFSAAALRGLLDAGFDIRAVITKPDSKKGRGQKISAPLVKTIAGTYDIPVWQPQKLADIKDDIRNLQPVAGVLVSYGHIVPQSIINLFTPGIINLHPSLLPKYRGPSPIEAALLSGDETTGVSIMQLSRDMDAGPVYHQVEYHLPQYETKPHLYKKLAEIGTSELIAALPRILSGTLQPTPQDDSAATYCHLLTKADGQLDPSAMTAEDAERRVRALLGYPKTRLSVHGNDVIITKARVADEPETALDTKFSDDKFLIIEELVSPSGKSMDAAAYVRGYLK